MDHIERSASSRPATLIKVMERRWAELLVNSGSMRFGSLAIYREWENEILGDPNDGEGMFHMGGHPYSVGYLNPVYAWCASLPRISDDRIRLMAAYGNYNCVVCVHDLPAIIQRIRAVLQGMNNHLYLRDSEIIYNRGAEVDQHTLNSQIHGFNVFQKSPDFAHDMEYRLSLTDASLRPEKEDYIDLVIENCSDIISIENIPSKSSREH